MTSETESKQKQRKISESSQDSQDFEQEYAKSCRIKVGSSDSDGKTKQRIHIRTDTTSFRRITSYLTKLAPGPI